MRPTTSPALYLQQFGRVRRPPHVVIANKRRQRRENTAEAMGTNDRLVATLAEILGDRMSLDLHAIQPTFTALDYYIRKRALLTVYYHRRHFGLEWRG